MAKRIKARPGQSITLPNGAVLKNEQELVVSDADFAIIAAQPTFAAAAENLGAAATRPGATQGQKGDKGDPGIVSLTRGEVTISTPALAANASHTMNVALGKGYRVFGLTLNQAARVRVYGTAAQQTADASRAATASPTPLAGCFLDYVAGPLTAVFAPPVDGVSLAAPPVATVPVTVTNLGASGSVSVTFKFLITEI